MNLLLEWLVAPFVEFSFMRRALVACLALGLGCGPVGVLLMLRRMSLMGDALSHAVLPGAAIGFLIAGFSLTAMSLGGFVAGLTVALLAGLVTRFTEQREDASFAAFYLISLALGVLIVSTRGSSVDLLHVLFGTILAVDDASLLLVASIASVSLADPGADLPALDRGVLRFGVFAIGTGAGDGLPSAVSHPGGAESGRRVSSPGNADGGGSDDAARRRGPVFGRRKCGAWRRWRRLSPCCPATSGCCCPITTTCPRVRRSS
jgi:hypothetical protein